MKPEYEKLLLIANPISGRGKASAKLVSLAADLERNGYAIRVVHTAQAGHARRIASQCPDDIATILVGGGDGTVREVAAGLLGRDIPLYHLPLGNENIFAKSFGMSLKPSRVLDALRRGARRTIDVVRVNGEVLCVACIGIGFDGHVVKLVCDNRTGTVSDMSYVKPIWQTFKHYDYPAMRVEADGKELFAGRGIVLAGNLPAYGGGLPVFRSAIPDDGLMDLLVLPCAGRGRFLWNTMLTLGGMPGLVGAIRLRCSRLKVASEADVPVQLDGDRGPSLPLLACVEPGSLTILQPPR